jgi:hypothetical protein
LDRLRLMPGESANLAVRIPVRGLPGLASRNSVTFTTNDPYRPTASISFAIRRMLGDLCTVPTSVDFGTVVAGDAPRQVVEVRDGGTPVRAIENIEVSDATTLTARVLPPSERGRDEHSGGRLIALVEVSLASNAPKMVDEEIIIHLAGEGSAIGRLPVRARFAAPIDISPPSLVLPRASGEGPLYFGRCMVRSIRGDALELRTDSVPPGLRVNITSANNKQSVRLVEVVWDWEQKASLSGRGPQLVVLQATVGDALTRVTIPVTCR